MTKQNTKYKTITLIFRKFATFVKFDPPTYQGQRKPICLQLVAKHVYGWSATDLSSVRSTLLDAAPLYPSDQAPNATDRNSDGNNMIWHEIHKGQISNHVVIVAVTFRCVQSYWWVHQNILRIIITVSVGFV